MFGDRDSYPNPTRFVRTARFEVLLNSPCCFRLPGRAVSKPAHNRVIEEKLALQLKEEEADAVWVDH